MTPPDLLVHADWSTSPAKRLMATATREARRYWVRAPEPVGPLETWIGRLAAGGTRVLVGVDFPIGLPLAYAQRAGVASLLDVLPAFGRGRWDRFYDIAEHPGEISPARPFYPYRPGGTERAHLVEGLGLDSFDDLLRECDRPSLGRRAAGALFWTMGAQQSGRGAIAGWRDVLAPALQSGTARLWPFDGDLDRLLHEPGVVVAEAYPADAALRLGLPAPGRGWSKRRQTDRAAHAARLISWAEQHAVVLSPVTERAIRSGFGAAATGEDAFDALLGLFGMLDVVAGGAPTGYPPDPLVRATEGWILGMPSR